MKEIDTNLQQNPTVPLYSVSVFSSLCNKNSTYKLNAEIQYSRNTRKSMKTLTANLSEK